MKLQVLVTRILVKAKRLGSLHEQIDRVVQWRQMQVQVIIIIMSSGNTEMEIDVLYPFPAVRLEIPGNLLL